MEENFWKEYEKMLPTFWRDVRESYGKIWRKFKEIFLTIWGDFRSYVNILKGIWRIWEHFGEGNSEENIEKLGNISRFCGKLWKNFEEIKKCYEYFWNILRMWWKYFEENIRDFEYILKKSFEKNMKKFCLYFEEISKYLTENFRSKYFKNLRIFCRDGYIKENYEKISKKKKFAEL